MPQTSAAKRRFRGGHGRLGRAGAKRGLFTAEVAERVSFTVGTTVLPYVAKEKPIRSGVCSPDREVEGIELLDQRIDCDPLAFRPTLEAEFGKLDAFGSAQEIPREGFVKNDVAQEEFPLDFEGVVVGLLIWNFRPALKEVDGLRNVGVPSRARRVAVVLNPDIA